MATPTDKGQGQFNLGAYSNPKVDELTLKIQSETDQKKRNEMIREAFRIHQEDVGHIPLHQQALAWATAKNVQLTQLPNNYMYFKWITLKPSPK
jgi:peptide/nickel transport system substrate-binding protein